jgi:hypothetical protein
VVRNETQDTVRREKGRTVHCVPLTITMYPTHTIVCSLLSAKVEYVPTINLKEGNGGS